MKYLPLPGLVYGNKVFDNVYVCGPKFLSCIENFDLQVVGEDRTNGERSTYRKSLVICKTCNRQRALVNEDGTDGGRRNSMPTTSKLRYRRKLANEPSRFLMTGDGRGKSERVTEKMPAEFSTDGGVRWRIQKISSDGL